MQLLNYYQEGIKNLSIFMEAVSAGTKLKKEGFRVAQYDRFKNFSELVVKSCKTLTKYAVGKKTD